jgi:hypothetical protein
MLMVLPGWSLRRKSVIRRWRVFFMFSGVLIANMLDSSRNYLPVAMGSQRMLGYGHMLEP